MQRMKTGLVVALISTLIAVFAMVGCNESNLNTGSNTLNPNITAFSAKGGLQVSLNFIKKSMSTKASDISDVIDSVTFHITGANLPAPINQTVQRADFKGPGWAVIQINDLLPGTINVTVEAKDASGNVIATGHQDNITVIPGDTIRIRIDCVINVGSVIIDFVCINCLPTPTVTIPASISPPSPMPTVCCPSVPPTDPPTTPPPTDPPSPTVTSIPGMSNPFNIEVHNSEVYVTDIGVHKVFKLDANLNLLSTLGSAGSAQGQFQSPYDVTFDTSNNIYVSDPGNYRVQKFDSNYTYLTQWGTSGSGDLNFNANHGIEVHGNSVYVADYYNYQIKKFDLSGNFITKWGSQGSGNGQFDPYPVFNLTVDSLGYLYVLDGMNSRIQKFDSDGNFVTNLAVTAYALTIGPNDFIYTADGGGGIHKYDSAGTYISSRATNISGATGIAVDKTTGYVYVAGHYSNNIAKISPF